MIGTVSYGHGGGIFDVAVNITVLPSMYELSNINRETLVDKDVVFWNASSNYGEPRQIDHGSDIAGLLDDDHTQYLKEEASGGLASEVPDHTHQNAANCGTLDHGLALTGLGDDDHDLYQRKHGFKRATDGSALVTISYDKTTRKITVTPTGANFTIWIDGVKYVKTTETAGTGHGTSTGMYYFYYNASGVLSVSAVATPWSILDRTVIPVAAVYYSNTLSDGISYFEAHGAERDIWEHYTHHFTEGTELISGAAITGYTLDTDSDAAITPAVASAIIADEDVVRTLSAVSDGGPYHVMYRTGATGEWVWDDTPTFPFISGTTYPKWNQLTGGAWQLTEMDGLSSGNYMNVFLAAHPCNVAAKQFAWIPGQATHATLASAQGEDYLTLSWGTLPFEEVVPIAKLTLHCKSTYAGTHKSRIVAVTLIHAKGIQITQSGSATVHNSLSGRSDFPAHPITAMSASETDTSKRLAPNGAGGVVWSTGGGGGASALNDLTDVDTAGAANTNVLAYESATSTWKPAAAGTPASHASSHQDGGADEIGVTGLSGLLADAQKIQVSKAGSLVGTRKNVNLVEGSNVTLTVADDAGNDRVNVTVAASGGSSLWSPDTPPGSPNTQDDEFTGSSLDAKWSVTINTGSPVIAYNSPSSRITLKLPGNATWEISQAYAPAGDFSLTWKFGITPFTSYQNVRLIAYDSDESDAVMAYAQYYGGWGFRLATKDSSSWTYNRSSQAVAALHVSYIHLQRTGSVWSVWGSLDGEVWFQVGTYTKTMTVHHFNLQLDQYGATTVAHWTMDWIRRDWKTF
jgi:hypothetical protein